MSVDVIYEDITVYATEKSVSGTWNGKHEASLMMVTLKMTSLRHYLFVSIKAVLSPSFVPP